MKENLSYVHAMVSRKLRMAQLLYNSVGLSNA